MSRINAVPPTAREEHTMTSQAEQPEPLVDAEADSVPPPSVPQTPSKATRILLGLSLVLIAANLRPVFSSVSVLLPEIIDGTGMSSHLLPSRRVSHNVLALSAYFWLCWWS
jgi:hypothetical protein